MVCFICQYGHCLKLLVCLGFPHRRAMGDADQLEVESGFPHACDEPPALPQQNVMTQRSDVLITWILLFLLWLQAKHYIPDSAGRHSDFVVHLAAYFPKSVYQMQKFFGIKEEFTRFVVCRKCYSVYEFKIALNTVEYSCLAKHVLIIHTPIPVHTVEHFFWDWQSLSVVSYFCIPLKFSVTKVSEGHLKTSCFILALLIFVNTGVPCLTVLSYETFMMGKSGRSSNTLMDNLH